MMKEAMFKVDWFKKEPTPSYDDPLGEEGFVSVKITNAVTGEQFGDWIVFKNVVDEGALKALATKVARQTIGKYLVKQIEEDNEAANTE